jgi:hypothetical protein
VFPNRWVATSRGSRTVFLGGHEKVLGEKRKNKTNITFARIFIVIIVMIRKLETW